MTCLHIIIYICKLLYKSMQSIYKTITKNQYLHIMISSLSSETKFKVYIKLDASIIIKKNIHIHMANADNVLSAHEILNESSNI